MKIKNTGDFAFGIALIILNIIGIIKFIEDLYLLTIFCLFFLAGIYFLFFSIELKGEKIKNEMQP